MNLNLAYSTCPNDTYIFDALVNNRIKTNGLSFNTTLADIEELNNLALHSNADIVKISYALYPFINENYQLLTSGGALGRGVGPLVVSKRKIYPDEVEYANVAIPGKHTTANLLFTLAYPKAKKKSVYLFSDIEEAVLSNEVDIGVIIHENRFTYQHKGLKKVIDLGEYWEKEVGLPIPLGGIAVRRSLPNEIKNSINTLVRDSVVLANQNPEETYGYVKKFAKAMDLGVMQKHIGLYVNSFSIDLGDEGMNAVKALMSKAKKSGYNDEVGLIEPIFVGNH
ncbi:MAG: 1,4-dihydroxy-6-naphthoate synthase [Bacteroidales bacterium]